MTDKNEAMPTAQALADVATDKNKLFKDGYVQGMAEFIKECATPMTIAIQGDWGSGKSSLIKLIEAELRAGEESAKYDGPDGRKYCKEIINVATFDAWHHTVANPSTELAAGILNELIEKLSGVDLKEMGKVSEFVSIMSQLIDAAIGVGEDSKDDSTYGSILSWIFGSKEEAKTEPAYELASDEDIEEFQTMFVDALQQYAKECGKTDDSRFVLFVDGLDHVGAEAAFDLVQQIKTYIDCPRCVYVLALDEETIHSGIKKKLGDKVDEGLMKKHFDKLVQVPLRIPRGAYNLDAYVKSLLKDENELSGEFVEVLNTLPSDLTPRSIKRYLNTMCLYRNVFGGSGDAGDGSLAMLLAAVILQIESAQGFNAVVKCARGDEAQFDENLQAVQDSMGASDGINWATLPGLWRGEDGVDEARRNAFISWAQKLK